MPRLSQKAQLQRDLHLLFSISTVTATSEIESDEALDYLILLEGLKEQRYLLPRSFIPKSNWALFVLSNLSDTRFRGYVRMNRYSLHHIVQLIQDDLVFFNRSHVSQTPVEDQLKYALFRMGHDGSGSGFLTSATFWGVSEGHIFNCIRRVVEALCRLKDRFVKWPDAKARIKESLANDTREKRFIEMVGKMNGTDIVLVIKSGGKYDGELFFNRKKRYVMNLCAICDSNKKFIYFLCGWSNSQHDQRIFATDDLHRNSTSFFSDGQYLLGDSAYTNFTYLVTLYKAPHTRDADIRRFNRRLSRIRIDIEHTFGILKGRWKSLIGLRVRIQNKKSYTFVIRWISACVVLHNILQDIQDEWNEDEGWWTVEEEAHEDELKQLNDRYLAEGMRKREHVKQLVLD